MSKSPIIIFILFLSLVFNLQAQTKPNQLNQQKFQIKLNQPIPVDPSARIGKLPNGLTYYIRKNDKPENKVELRLVVNAGSLVEREDQRGLAHFVEHMAFNGTTNFKKNELVAYLQSIGVSFGGDLNASTSFDETIYILPIPTKNKELIDKGLLVLSDWAGGIVFDQSEIDKERGVVLEELRARQGAGQRMMDKYFPKLFEDSQYAVRMPIGVPEVLNNFKRQTILDFYETWYRPDLMAVVAVGDLDVNEMEAKIKRQFSGLKAKRKIVERPVYSVPDTKGTRVIIETDKETPGTNIQIIYKKPAFKIRTQGDLRRQLIQRIYTSLLNSRIAEIQQSPNSPFLYAGVGFNPIFRENYSFTMSGSTSPQNVEATITALLNENRRVQKFGFIQPELERIKKSYLTSLENTYKEKNNTTSKSYAQTFIDFFLTGEPSWSGEFNYQFGKAVTPTITLEEVNKLAHQTTDDKNFQVVITGPEKADTKLPTQAEIIAVMKKSETAKLTPYTETFTTEPLIENLPETAKVTDVKIDNEFGITHWKLSNGVKVVLKQTDFKDDEIRMSAFSPGGMSLLDTEKARSGVYFDTVIGQSGVKNLSRIQLNKMLAGKRASASIGVNELFETASGYSTPKDLETMLQLTYLKFTNVNFDKEVFDSIIAKQKTSLAAVTASPQAYFGEQVFKIFTQNHPRAFSPLDKTIPDKAKFEDIKEIYKDRFGDASDFTFIFVGNFEPDTVKPLIVKYLGNLPSRNRSESWKDWNVEPPGGPLNKTFSKGVDNRSIVQIIYTGKTDYNKDENRNLTMLGELLTIKLLEVLREEKSGVYGVNATGNINKLPSGKFAFTIQFACAPKNVDELIAAVNAEIANLQKGKIEENELNKVKEKRLISIDPSYKTNSFWMSVISNNLIQGSEILPSNEAKGRINAVTKTDLEKAAQKYLIPENRLQFILMPETEVNQEKN